MKLLQIIPSMDPRVGGPMEGVRQIALAGTRLGHEITVLSLDVPEAVASLLDPRYALVALGPGAGKFAYTPRLVPWLRAHAGNFDAVLVHGLWQFSSFGAWLGLRESTVPYYVFPHGMLDPWFKRTYPWKHLKKWLYWPWADYRVLRDARGVLFTSGEERDAARRSFWLYHCNEEVVGFGISGPQVDRERAEDAFFTTAPAARSRRIVLYLSRIHEKKGCDLLLQAFARVAGRDPDLHLVIAGSGDAQTVTGLQALAEQLGIADRTTWTGRVDDLVKWGALYSASIYVLPSHQENFAMSVVEALACSTPVAVSNKVNIWREVVAAGAGWADEDTVAGTVRSLEHWLELDAGALNDARTRARRCFDQHYEQRRFGDILFGVLQRSRCGDHGGQPLVA